MEIANFPIGNQWYPSILSFRSSAKCHINGNCQFSGRKSVISVGFAFSLVGEEPYQWELSIFRSEISDIRRFCLFAALRKGISMGIANFPVGNQWYPSILPFRSSAKSHISGYHQYINE